MADYLLDDEVIDGGDDTTETDDEGTTETGTDDTSSGDTSTSGSDDDSTSGSSSEGETSATVVNDEESILNPEYVKKVKESQFGELYGRLVSDEKESQCAEFLAPQLVKQDRLYEHTFKAAFGSFY